MIRIIFLRSVLYTKVMLESTVQVRVRLGLIKDLGVEEDRKTIFGLLRTTIIILLALDLARFDFHFHFMKLNWNYNIRF